MFVLFNAFLYMEVLSPPFTKCILIHEKSFNALTVLLTCFRQHTVCVRREKKK